MMVEVMSLFGAVFVESEVFLRVSVETSIFLLTESGICPGLPCPKTEDVFRPTRANKIMLRKMKRTVPGLTVRPLSFIEKFTNLGQVIAKHPSIINTAKNIGFKALLLAITLLNLS